LELDSIASDARKVVGELSLENHPAFLKFTRQQSNRFSYSVIQVQRFGRNFRLGDQPA
jgi:hypothetical protein